MPQQKDPISLSPGLPMCVAPGQGDSDVCRLPAIAKISGHHNIRYVCHYHLQLAEKYYEKEPLARKEDIEYLTARQRA